MLLLEAFAVEELLHPDPAGQLKILSGALPAFLRRAESTFLGRQRHSRG